MMHGIITCHERDLPWIDNIIKCLLQEKNEA